jgi:hypothetical protein|tara:strand:+ start:320 stop:661 length:342 start_codon:yes stop_codon:yes gene_type:complete
LKESYEGTMMKAAEIDEDGNWIHEGEKIPLVGSTIPVPDTARLRGEPEQQEVLYMTTALVKYDNCLSCNEHFDETYPCFVTEYGARMIPARCCDTFIWITDEIGEEYDGRADA